MDAVVDFLTSNTMLITFVVLVLGALLGAVRIGGVPIGPAAVLFVAIALSAVDPELRIPQVVGDVGMVVFAYTIGIGAGATFIRTFRSNVKPLVGLSLALCVVAAVAWLMGMLLGIDDKGAFVSGMFAGGVTNTPALGAAKDVLAGTEYGNDPTVGYSIAYIWGVVGMILAVAFAMVRSVRKPTVEDRNPPAKIVSRTVRVTAAGLPSVGALTKDAGGGLQFSRYRHGDKVAMATRDVVLEPDDMVTFTGPEPAVEALAVRIGEPSNDHLPLDRHELDHRRVIVSNRSLNGRTIGSLDLPGRFGAVPVRVRRGDVDTVASDDFVLQPGDRLRVTAPRDRIGEVSQFLGDSERGSTDMNPVGFTVGVVLGILIGMISIPIPGIGSLSLGNAAGPLVVGLVLGYLGHVGPLRFLMPYGATQTLNQFGMLLFLAGVGGGAGASFVDAIQTGLGAPLLLGGFVVTTTYAVLIILVARVWLGMAGPKVAGFIAGAQTQPGVLAYAQERTADARVPIGYATAFAGTTIVKVILVQVLAAPYV